MTSLEEDSSNNHNQHTTTVVSTEEALTAPNPTLTDSDPAALDIIVETDFRVDAEFSDMIPHPPDANAQSNNNATTVVTPHNEDEGDVTMATIMKELNATLEEELAEHKTAVLAFFQELANLQTVAAEVQVQWTPVQEAEQAEAARLDQLQSDVSGSVNLKDGRNTDAAAITAGESGMA